MMTIVHHHNCTKRCLSSEGSQHVISSMMVPVWISYVDDPRTERLIYVLLGDQSDTMFISEKTLSYLNVNRPKTQLSLSTIHAENKLIPSQKIKGLVMSDVNPNMQIQLPQDSPV